MGICSKKNIYKDGCWLMSYHSITQYFMYFDDSTTVQYTVDSRCYNTAWIRKKVL